MSGRLEPEYALNRAMSSEQTHDEQLRKEHFIHELDMALPR